MDGLKWLVDNHHKALSVTEYADDYRYAAAFALAFPCLRYILNKTMYEPLGKRFMFRGKKGKLLPGSDSAKRMSKWTESCWKMTVYSSFSLLGLIVSWNKPWLNDTRYFWRGCTDFPCNHPSSRDLRWLYSVSMGFYIYSIPSLFLWEIRRKDFLEQIAHHFVTLFLIVYSHYVNFMRVGGMVMLLHDLCDIWLEFAKLGNYANNEMLSTALFVVFLVVWIAMRIVYFPFWIIRSTLFEVLSEVHAIVPHVPREPHYTLFNGLLIVLLALHLYWTVLIIKVVLGKLRSGRTEDVRED
uniref:Acyl-CoA-dependent ceramide synthase n=1 Tax=Tetraselmis sp. GSL018 TaxID=582737 RepID=A0A061RHE7_9CHLO|mmetsp:Transcript_38371/g.91009  ORF Transcript_38371/g.91009 Transcript_38371/m.91009 type:complete len:297 (-) Transcript_38371:63-953(-)